MSAPDDVDVLVLDELVELRKENDRLLAMQKKALELARLVLTGGYGVDETMAGAARELKAEVKA